MEEVIKINFLRLKKKVLELIEEYEDFAEEYYGSDDEDPNLLPIYFLDVDVIRENFDNYSAEVTMDDGR